MENLHGAFELREGRDLSGKRLLLVDDVMTTGATLRSFARAVDSAKPRSMQALVIAVADPRHNHFQVL
jgi:predicted amidophosphoribosyltransferase